MFPSVLVVAPVLNIPYPCPHQSLVEGDLRFRRRHFREERREGLDEIEKADYTSSASNRGIAGVDRAGAEGVTYDHS